MTTLEERIRDLEAKIEKYEAKCDAATTEAGQERYANLIIASRNNLTALLQLQQSQGEYLSLRACHSNIAA